MDTPYLQNEPVMYGIFVMHQLCRDEVPVVGPNLQIKNYIVPEQSVTAVHHTSAVFVVRWSA